MMPKSHFLAEDANDLHRCATDLARDLWRQLVRVRHWQARAKAAGPFDHRAIISRLRDQSRRPPTTNEKPPLPTGRGGEPRAVQLSETGTVKSLLRASLPLRPPAPRLCPGTAVLAIAARSHTALR